MVSIGNIVSKFKGSNQILTHPNYKQIEGIINSEEYPIVMFLTTLRSEMEEQNVQSYSSLLDAEMKELFSISMSQQQMQYILGCLVASMVHSRNLVSDSRDLLRLCYQVANLDTEAAGNFQQPKSRVGGDDITRNLDSHDEVTLLNMIASSGLAF